MIRVQTIWLQTAKRYILLCCCVLAGSITNAQFSPYNLIPNPSFEQYTNCPYYLANLRNDKPDYWYKPDLRGARYFNACANGYDYNYNGMPVNFGGGGRIINTHVQVMVMLFYFIIMVWIQEIIYR